MRRRHGTGIEALTACCAQALEIAPIPGGEPHLRKARLPADTDPGAGGERHEKKRYGGYAHDHGPALCPSIHVRDNARARAFLPVARASGTLQDLNKGVEIVGDFGMIELAELDLIFTGNRLAPL